MLAAGLVNTGFVRSPKVSEAMKDGDRIIRLVSSLCELNKDFLKNVSSLRDILKNGAASNKEKTRELFKPMMILFSYQGIADEKADKYWEKHGYITYLQITRKLNGEYGRICTKLKDFGSFDRCGYIKGSIKRSKTCSKSRALEKCPVPTHDLRKGSLNQTAYHFYFFLRDVCRGDLISYIDRIIKSHVISSSKPCREAVRNAGRELIKEFSRIHGV
jgi:hypothetical protein